MSSYARSTTVPVSRSKAEIEEILKRYGASEFMSGWNAEAGMISFRKDDLRIRFIVPMPKKDDKRFTHKKDRWGQIRKRSDLDAAKEWEQEERRRWRALALVVKAKLEAIESGISTIVQEFMAFVVLPDDRSLGQWIIDQVIPQIKAGNVPMLGYRPMPSGDVQDAEIISSNGK